MPCLDFRCSEVSWLEQASGQQNQSSETGLYQDTDLEKTPKTLTLHWRFPGAQWPPSSWNRRSLEQPGLSHDLAVQPNATVCRNGSNNCWLSSWGSKGRWKTSRRSSFTAVLHQSEFQHRVVTKASPSRSFLKGLTKECEEWCWCNNWVFLHT